MTEPVKTSLASIGVPRAIFGVVLVIIFLLPRLPFFNPPHLLTPIDQTFLHWYVSISAVLGYFAFFGFFMWGNWNVANAGLGIIVGIFAFMIAALCGGMAYFSGMQFYSYYELILLPHRQHSMFYAVPSISVRGRGGYRAWVNPYGATTWGLPLSKADYDAFRAGTLTPPGLCYRVTELRHGRTIGIIEPSEWSTPDALVRCRTYDLRRVNDNKPHRI